MRLALFGGIYNNYLALEAAMTDARRRGAEAMCCLGDMGAFGPYPDRTCELLREFNVECVQGNYDDSIGNDLADCQCGYTDPRDNHFAQISYEYTYKNTSEKNRNWLRSLPAELQLEIGDIRLLLCHGSPRKTNEFLWESTTSTHFLDKLADDFHADVIAGTHTGIHWQRALRQGRQFVNVGVLGRPENDGGTHVWYTMLSVGTDLARAVQTQTPADVAAGRSSPCAKVEFVAVEYDHERLAREMRVERLPDEFVETILTGWWTTCLEVLPAKERRRGKF